ncbi:MAG TPA: hypothetical protein VFX76_04085 [Roseiflexaceae bacterium]|nr:hypothetical protein [Roseiflexaceae bacterium]
MSIILTIHRILGEMILPLVIIIVAIWLTVTWKPGAAQHPAARFFPVLVDIQVTLGLLFFIYGLIIGNPRYFSFPFILHPIVGILAAGVAHMGVRPDGPARNLGRWAPLATLGVLLLLVIGNIMLAMSA